MYSTYNNLQLIHWRGDLMTHTSRPRLLQSLAAFTRTGAEHRALTVTTRAASLSPRPGTEATARGPSLRALATPGGANPFTSRSHYCASDPYVLRSSEQKVVSWS